MGRRRELKSIASGLIGSFKSRNNDVAGYWGIGKLSKFAETNGTDEVAIDLLAGFIQPTTCKFDGVISHYKAMFMNNIASLNIPNQWVSKVIITVLFNQEYVEKYHFFGAALGSPCICKCEITDDNGQKYTVTTGTNCKPHNPKNESKSNRANDI
ncbi:hypothetical protein [Parashewanella tropica]|uniref:hypothetical protein n=1 Tax=Parashewanella tropica TaxID=2547970 RepID=UPI001059A5A3|nr:hypothetical protein [Parashewanella tropica]